MTSARSCIPNLFVATGSQLWGDQEAYPWLIGSIPSYATEAAVFADYLKANKPDAKVAILAQNDDFGAGLRGRLQEGDRGHGHHRGRRAEVQHHRP